MQSWGVQAVWNGSGSFCKSPGLVHCFVQSWGTCLPEGPAKSSVSGSGGHGVPSTTRLWDCWNDLWLFPQHRISASQHQVCYSYMTHVQLETSASMQSSAGVTVPLFGAVVFTRWATAHPRSLCSSKSVSLTPHTGHPFDVAACCTWWIRMGESGPMALLVVGSSWAWCSATISLIGGHFESTKILWDATALGNQRDCSSWQKKGSKKCELPLNLAAKPL